MWRAFRLQHLIFKPEEAIFRFIGEPLMFGAIGALLPCFASLWADLRIKKRWLRILLLCVSVLLFILYGAGILGWVTGGISGRVLIYLSTMNRVWFFFPGLGIFLGLNK